MTKTKKISSTILFSILSIFLVIGSIFTFNTIKKSDSVVFADSVTTNFNGSNVYFPTNPIYSGYSNTWNVSPFNNAIYGSYVWSYNDTIYYNLNTTELVFNKSTLTWSTVDNSLLTSSYVRGDYIYSYNGSTFYVSGSSSTRSYFYFFNGSHFPSSSQHSVSLPNSLAGRGFYVNNNLYFSYNGTNKIVNDTFGTPDFTWYGLTNFDGSRVWTDGVDYYYSYNGLNYLLNVSTFTWSSISFSGLTNFDGSCVWNFNGKTYYSYNNDNYIFDKSTLTWSPYVWENFSPNYGAYIWSFDNLAFFSSNDTQYYLETGDLKTRTSFLVFNSVSFDFIDNGNGSFNLSHHSFIFNNESFDNCSISDKFVIVNNDEDFANVTTNDFLDFIVISSQFNANDNYYIPYSFNGTYYFIYIDFEFSQLSNVSFTSVMFFGSVESAGSNYITTNSLIYSNSLNETFRIKLFMSNLSSNAGYVVEYFGDTFPLNDILNDSTYTWLDNYSYVFKQRTYYLNNDYLNSQQYQRGYSVGYNNGQNAGYSSGYSAGVEAVSQTQYNSGYSAGYNEGVSNSNNYSFLGLISAVIDAPIKAFTGLFNFNLLGVNIMQFITALFTLAVIITIVKKVV